MTSTMTGTEPEPKPVNGPHRPRANPLAALARIALASPRTIIAVAVLVMAGAAVFGLPAASSLSGGGFVDPASESARGAVLLAQKFHRGDMQLLLLVSSDGNVNEGPARAVGVDIASKLARSPFVTQVASPWNAPTPPPGTVSADGKSALIVAALSGDENTAPEHAKALASELAHDRDGVTVRAGGPAMLYAQIDQQTQKDLLRIQAVAAPVSFAALIWTFGGLLAAAIPMAVAGFAIVGSLAALRGVALFTHVSIFALDLGAALGMALAIDYTLLIISRYRDELDAGRRREEALIATMATAGRTVLFSAMTMALSMAPMVLFPVYFLRSFAYAGIAVATLAALAAVIIAPAVLALLGERIDALNVRRLGRRLIRRPEPVPQPAARNFWYRTAISVMRRPVTTGLAVIGLLLLLGSPFLHVRWGNPDERVLPPTATSREVGDVVRTQFNGAAQAAVTIVVPEIDEPANQQLDAYAEQLSRVADVAGVSSPTGTFVAGVRTGPPTAPAGVADGSAFVTVSSTAPLYSAASDTQLDRLHRVAAPGGQAVQMAGNAQISRDALTAITSRLPLVLGFIAVVMLVLLFMLTGSVVLPLKAIVLNILSLTAAFGALVWVFQDGHLGALGTTPSGTLVATIPAMMFCIAFGVSMDYEVFLISRIREYWLASARTRADNDESVALGIARTGRVITAAAMLMSASFAAMTIAKVSFMRMFGVGLTLAVLMDATLVRMLLVPAFMRVFGGVNWWAPRGLLRLRQRMVRENSDGVAQECAPGTAGGSGKTAGAERI
jgi:RND superfamily putative drug exporter